MRFPKKAEEEEEEVLMQEICINKSLELCPAFIISYLSILINKSVLSASSVSH